MVKGFSIFKGRWIVPPLSLSLSISNDHSIIICLFICLFMNINSHISHQMNHLTRPLSLANYVSLSYHDVAMIYTCLIVKFYSNFPLDALNSVASGLMTLTHFCRIQSLKLAATKGNFKFSLKWIPFFLLITKLLIPNLWSFQERRKEIKPNQGHYYTHAYFCSSAFYRSVYCACLCWDLTFAFHTKLSQVHLWWCAYISRVHMDQ